MTEQEQIEALKQQLTLAKQALNDIVAWNDDLEDEWGDPGFRAKDTLLRLKIADGFYD